jgi:hypothetical protein
MKIPAILPLVLLTLPLHAQAWDVRVEVPFPQGQNLPLTLIQGTGQLVSGSLDTGRGAILSVSHRIIRVGPVLKLEWGGEFATWKADGEIRQGTGSVASRLKQTGLGLGVNAQFWVPFTGLAGELGVIERFHSYSYSGAGAAEDHSIARPWLRVGARFNLPFPGVSPYVAASYQQPFTRDRPVQVNSIQNVAAYLGAQGSGQEFQRLWTFGVGLTF